MRRYRFLNQNDTYSALIRLNEAFLAAKNGEEVFEIINGLLSEDEKLKIGRRILVAEYLQEKISIDAIARELKVGKNTISSVTKSLDTHPVCFELLKKRKNRVEQVYKKKAYKPVGGSLRVIKLKTYTGFKRKQVER